MLSFKRDPFKKELDQIKELIDGDRVIYQFDVVPIDYNVTDWFSPTLILTDRRLIFHYDDLYEVYALEELEVDCIGQKPQFSLFQIYAEGSFEYSSELPEGFTKIRAAEKLTRMEIKENGQVTKEFLLRMGTKVQKGYQNWAMTQIVKNSRNNAVSDPIFFEMVEGVFSRFNAKTIYAFIGVFLSYVLLKALTVGFNNNVVNTLFDITFALILLGLSFWIYLSINKNLGRYKRVYLEYQNIL